MNGFSCPCGKLKMTTSAPRQFIKFLMYIGLGSRDLRHNFFFIIFFIFFLFFLHKNKVFDHQDPSAGAWGLLHFPSLCPDSTKQESAVFKLS